MADTGWLNEFESTSDECGAAKIQVTAEQVARLFLTGSPVHTWPISRDGTWNPDGYPESKHPTATNPTHN